MRGGEARGRGGRGAAAEEEGRRERVGLTFGLGSGGATAGRRGGRAVVPVRAKGEHFYRHSLATLEI